MDNNDFARFPIKLHRVLEMASKETQLSDVISWLPCGTAFAISDQLAFSHLVMPVHFASMHSFKSFRRQLNLYGFKKQYNKDSGKREVGGAYGHPLFLRDRSDLAAQISRAPNASKSRRRSSKTTSQQGSSACSDSSGGSMNKDIRFKLEGIEYPSTDRLTILTANSISLILSELERHDVFDHNRGEAYSVHDLPDGTSKDSINATSVANGTCGMESLFMPSWREIEEAIEVDRDDIRTEIIKTFLW